jgi:MFS family permease
MNTEKLIACCLSGITILIPLFPKIFGKEFGAELYGLTGIFVAIASLVGPLLIKLIVKDVEDYLTVYLIGAGLGIIKLIALICFKENKPYVFEYMNLNEYNIDPKLTRSTQLEIRD